jgi:hypothetical protein
VVEQHIIVARLMELQRQSMNYLLTNKDGLRSQEYKTLQLEIYQLQTQLSNAYKRTPTQNTDAD